jgi:hypothetical protein
MTVTRAMRLFLFLFLLLLLLLSHQTKLEFRNQFSTKQTFSVQNFKHIRPVGDELFPADGQTDITKSTLAFSNTKSAPNKYCTVHYQGKWEIFGQGYETADGDIRPFRTAECGLTGRVAQY